MATVSSSSLGLDPRSIPMDGVDENGDTYESIIQDQDDAQAVMQPALSAHASHLTSQNTPAFEKALAMKKQSLNGHFDLSSGEGDDGGDSSPELASSPERTPRIGNEKPRASGATRQPKGDASQKLQKKRRPDISLNGLPSSEPNRDPLPSPWHSGPKQLMFKDTDSRPSKGMLHTAFGQSRARSRSAGQDALRKLQKALPSLPSPSHLLPSFSTSFFPSFSDKPSQNSSRTLASNSPSTPTRLPISPPATPTPLTPRASTPTRQLGPRSHLQANCDSVANPMAPNPTRPAMLRRVTSDESMLYHTLSHASSFGDDDQFQDVREMVNMRFKALKDSLPDRPNFKMPSLPKLHNSTKKPLPSLMTIPSTEVSSSQSLSTREMAAAAKDPATALDRVLEHLTGDIVILGGYRGSVLRSAEPPHQQVWAPVKLGLNMRKVNLEIGLEDEDEERMEESIISSGMLQHIGPIDVSRKLFKKLRSCENARLGKLRVHDFGYDWRLSPPLSSRRLQDFLEKLPSNQPGVPAESRGAIVIAHSLGGLITRHAVNARPDLFSGVLSAGVPQRCINILGPIRNGDVVLFNEKLLTAQVNFSIRSSFVFLPEDGFCFVNKETGEEYPIDFYDAQEWVKARLSPCVAPTLPAYTPRPQPTTFSSFLTNPLRSRADSKGDKQPPSPSKDRMLTPQLHSGTMPANTAESTQNDQPTHTDPERERYVAYLTRTLAMIRKFRSELTHRQDHQEANAYPPLALMYGKNIPTVYAASVPSRDTIPCADAYDDLLFRPGDGVVLAKEAMLPEGYHLVRGGRICTERGHITMLGDMPAVGRALEVLLRGRKKGIGLGEAGMKKVEKKRARGAVPVSLVCTE